MNATQQTVRRTLRYPLHLPVSVKVGNKEMHARSENIGLASILLSIERLIPVGSAVELAVGVAHLPDNGIVLTAKGRVLRSQPKASGDFAVAIECDRPFEFMRRRI